ncbi:hypothetical protein N7448_001828 [Penicillium atrosanguineum]|uniref:Luciferase domain-containing protein n=1 Tax=Penicillium atrosanguineum TaxID=1132637 RepID=A0A9W9HJ25_9EURO|nr:uncharacterized protein N7443_005226 [Penicillium atrosanguineum]KAJ5133142.1 hypothetical protein N7526_004507 [Penicillium atrosanguineum]KAJ5150250.1 hypothetical protein N7448_001828 [Penicillium atrosanguineum]KAJ5305566.1 hypothetical protein N7443_005226 [Penicillium atrosanguineum]KAJ5325028.1 hypothetical protein N7476_003628 [Penicillium atrosanguineum]
MADTFTHALSRVRLDRLTLALSTAAVLGTALVLPSVYRDYRTFRNYGPGGLPNNVIGWLTCRALFQPFKGEMFSTEEYVRRVEAAEGHGKGDEGFLELSPEQLASRSVTDRPVVGPHVVPQRQLTQIPDEDVMEKLRSAFSAFGYRNHHLVKVEYSNLERHSDALFLADHLPATDLAQTMQGEIVHIHSGYDHSIHVVCSPADCKKILDAGWGQRHGFSGTSAMTYLSLGTLPDLPLEYILIYAPRTEADIKTIMDIIAAGVKFMTGREDTR